MWSPSALSTSPPHSRFAFGADGVRIRAVQRRGHGTGVAGAGVRAICHRRLREVLSRRPHGARRVERLERTRKAGDGVLRRVRLIGSDVANVTQRVPYARQLDQREAAPFMDLSYIDGDQWALPPMQGDIAVASANI
ncbi:hypothetical protein PR202_ga16738 [Eleusine coracana subsp. coracana]|uniref:Uncharacterized protein n=1 Tax=Eleusine coracana subsp. coracana TaxID=191504 RepID=A0AAV5CML0_ELECO|nr:hypothetical protein PR202_ga16738 [Eleusine coracana subsp. coracana]